MLLQAAHEMNLDLLHSYLVGDAATDLTAGQKVGCLTYLVLTGRGKEQLVSAFRSAKNPFSIAHNLPNAINQILKTEWHITSTTKLQNPLVQPGWLPVSVVNKQA